MTGETTSSTPFDWSEDQLEIRAMVRKKLVSMDGPMHARNALEDPADASGESPDDVAALHWSDLAGELGLAGLTLPEEHGGAGCGRVELAILGEEMGRALVGGHYLSTVVLAAEALLVSGAPQATELLPAIAEGNLLGALAVAESSAAWDRTLTRWDGSTVTGVKQAVVGGAAADLLVVSAVDDSGLESLLLVDPTEAGDTLRREPAPVLDGTRPMATVTFDRTPARLLGGPGNASDVLRRVRETAAIYLAAEQAGGSRACVELTAEHARTRIQFGQPIGRFQGVKHRLADMEVRTYQAHSASVWAAWQEPGSEFAATGAAVARLWCSQAFVQNAYDTIQLHGGLGITWEHDAHLHLRRAQASAGLLGPASTDRAHLARDLGVTGRVTAKEAVTS